jgi:hypothetical protein
MRARRFAMSLSFIAFGCALAACGGGGSHSLPALPSTSVAPASTAQGSASFSITIPAATTAASVRRAQYISSSTTSVRIDVRQAGAEVSGFPVTLGVTAGSPNCTTLSGSTTCTLSINVLPGSYTASVTSLDVNGNAISTAVAVPLTIATGTVTNVPLTLNGVLAALAVIPTASSAPTFVSGSASAGYALIGQGPRSFTITAADANGHTIIGPGTPSFSVTASGPVALTVVQPTTSAPNAFTLTPPSVWTSGSDQLTVNVTYADRTSCSATGGTCSATTSVAMRELLLVNQNTLGNAIGLYPEGDTAPMATITQGVSGPSPVWWSPNGDIVSGNDAGTYNVTAYAFPYQSAPYATITTSTNPTNGIIWTAEVDPSGNLLVTDFFGSAIRVYSPPFTTPASLPSTPTTTITNGLGSPGSFVIDRQGNVFAGNGNGGAGNTVTEYAAKSFAKIATITPPFTMPTGFCCVSEAVAPNTNVLAVSSGQEPTLWLYAPPYTGAPIATIATGSGSSSSFDASGNLFVQSGTGDFIYAPPYTGTPVTFAPSTPVSGCNIDDSGTIFCMQPSGGEMDIFPKPYSSTPSVRVTTGMHSTGAPQIIP